MAEIYHTVLIPLSQEAFAIIDFDDYERVGKHKWHRSHFGYAVRFIGKRCIYMHREIKKTPEGLDTDHINRTKLDNRRVNLRSANRRQNAHNIGKKKVNTSGEKGVFYHKPSGRWQAGMRLNGKQIFRMCATFEEAVALRRQWEVDFNPTGLATPTTT